MKDCLTRPMWHTKKCIFREMQFWSHCYTVVSYQALFRLSVYKIPAVYLSGAKNVCFCTIRDFGSPTIYNAKQLEFEPVTYFIAHIILSQLQGSHRNSKTQFHDFSMIFHDQQCNFHALLMHRLQPPLFSGIFTTLR